MPDLSIKEMNTFLLLVLCCCAIIGVSSSRILLSAPLGSKSHQNMYIPLIKELAKRNHQVTFITNFESSDLREMSDHVTQIVLPRLVIPNDIEMTNTFETLLAGEWFNWKGFYIMMKVMISMNKQSTELLYDLPEVKKIILEEKFDLVIVSSVSPASYAFAWHYKTPVILISPGPLLTGMSSFLGADENFSYVPFWMSNFSDRMTFYERVMNLLISKIFNYVTLESQLPVYLSIIRERVLPDCPPLDQIERESVGLILTNSHPVFNYPRSLAPQVIEVGGSHCRQPKPLDTVCNFLPCH